ncbi:MAG: hypothetical protein M1835_000867 [Candelina submexicana]|nr:MAG: hypothetical protein M1835_000867 [Candelina submexicana]
MTAGRSYPRPFSPQPTGATTKAHDKPRVPFISTSQLQPSLPRTSRTSASANAAESDYSRPTQPPHSSPSSNMAKIRSSPSHGALAAAKSAPSHAKLHKRGNSASSAQSPSTQLPAFDMHASVTYNFPKTPRPNYDDIYNSTCPSPSSVSMTKTKIKPLLKKLTSGENASLDLSRSAAENEGLGIYTSDLGVGSRTAADVTFITTGKRGGYHNRSTSATSQFSTATSGSNQRPGGHYIHPMRQTPRPYTPPIAQSYATSFIGSEYSGEATSEEAHHLRQAARETPRHTPTTSASYQAPPSLRIQTNTSWTRLLHGSQTNLSSTPSSVRPRVEAMSATDTVSPISRSSMDTGFRKRSRSNTDPASRAASIQAARQAFTEKESAKARKAQQEELRVIERQRKREERGRKKSDAPSRLNVINDGLNEKGESMAGKEYAHLNPVPSHNIPVRVSDVTDTPAAPVRSNTTAATKGAARNRWIGFLTWLRTKIFRLGKKVAKPA